MNPKLFFKRNASTILTCMGGVGVVATSVMTAKATPKALKLINKAKEEKGENLTKLEAVKIAGPAYIPAVVTGATTIACIFGANILNKRHQASLMSAYALIDNSYKEYKDKLVELYGQETHESIVDAIAVEKSEDTYIHASTFASSCNLAAEEHASEPVLFYEEYGERYFESTIEQVITAEYHLNRNYVLRGYADLNELYEFFGLEKTDYGETVGWSAGQEIYWIDFNHRKIITKDDREAYLIEMPFGPMVDYEYY